eukprot:scaffold91530_cov57-Phaeocystis_antarctica.AAC.2
MAAEVLACCAWRVAHSVLPEWGRDRACVSRAAQLATLAGRFIGTSSQGTGRESEAASGMRPMPNAPMPNA